MTPEQQAEELLPCRCIKFFNEEMAHYDYCPASFRPAVAAALGAKDAKNNDLQSLDDLHRRHELVPNNEAGCSCPSCNLHNRYRTEIERLKEWRNSVSGAIKQLPEFHSGEWAGDKEGWGFHFEVVRWMQREIERLKKVQAYFVDSDTRNGHEWNLAERTVKLEDEIAQLRSQLAVATPRVDDDGLWICLKPPSGREALICLSAKKYGPLVTEVIEETRQWIAQAERKG